MPKILVVYYSHTGNTEKIAKAIVEGAKTVQKVEADLKRHESPWNLEGYDAILIGAPTYSHNIPNNIRKFLEEIAFQGVNLKGKIGAAFGSYGWSGEAPRMVLEVMEHKFEMEVVKPPLLIKYAPDEKSLKECHTLGKTVAERIVGSS